MHSVGQILSQQRQARGQSLDQVSSSTRISLKNLQAIEADDPGTVQSAFFYKSFVKQFAQAVDLDYAALEPAVQAIVSAIPPPLVPGQTLPGQDSPRTSRIAALRIGPHRKARLLYSLCSFAAALIACSALYSGWQTSRLNLPGSWKALSRIFYHPSAAPTVSASQTHTDPASLTQAPEPQTGQPPTEPSSPLDETAASENGYKIVVSAIAPAWLLIVTDGKQSFKGILETTETKVLEGHQNARLRTGNAGAVTVVFNGRSLGALGPRGQVRTVVFTKSDYEVLDSLSHVALTRFIETVALLQPFQRPAPAPEF